MKLKDTFIMSSALGGYILLSVDSKEFNGVIRLNETASFIVEQLKNQTTEANIIEAVCTRYNVKLETAKKDTWQIINELRSVGAIDE